MDSDSDVDMSWVQLVQDSAPTATDKSSKRELSPSTALEITAEAKRVRLESGSIPKDNIVVERHMTPLVKKSTPGDAIQMVDPAGDERLGASAAHGVQGTGEKTTKHDNAASEEKLAAAKVKMAEVTGLISENKAMSGYVFEPHTMITLNNREHFAGFSYILDTKPRPKAEPPLFGYDTYKEQLEERGKFHDKIYKRDPPFKTRLFDLEIESWLIYQHVVWTFDKISAADLVGNASESRFYHTLQKDLTLDFMPVYKELEEHKERGKHLRLENHWEVIQEKKEQAAKKSAASQAAVEPRSPSSDAYKNCVDAVPLPSSSEGNMS